MKINIGTTKGNIVGFEIDKEFDDIRYSEDIHPVIVNRFGTDVGIIGWAPWSDIQPIDLVGNLTDEEIEEL